MICSGLSKVGLNYFAVKIFEEHAKENLVAYVLNPGLLRTGMVRHFQPSRRVTFSTLAESGRRLTLSSLLALARVMKGPDAPVLNRLLRPLMKGSLPPLISLMVQQGNQEAVASGTPSLGKTLDFEEGLE